MLNPIFVRRAAGPAMLLLAALLAGCNQPTLFPNPDPALRKSNKQWASDAAARFPYKADAPRVFEGKARAQVVYDLNRIEVVNFTGQDWTNVEVWVNRQYVCHVPKMESGKLKEIHYPMLYNELGKTFPLHNKKEKVQTVEFYRDGVMYEVICRPADI